MRDVLAWFNCGDRTSERGRGRRGGGRGTVTVHLWGCGEREERGGRGIRFMADIQVGERE